LAEARRVSKLEESRAELAGLIRQYQRDTDAFDQAVADRVGLTRTDLRCVDLLLDLTMNAGDVTPKSLAEAAGLTPSTLTNILDRLERARYVRRVRDVENRRQVFLQITPELGALIADIFGPVAEAAAVQLNRYSGPELDVLIRFFAEAHDQRTQRTTALSGKGDVA
jgi:DNA-binding MarR family transcriptional regulator